MDLTGAGAAGSEGRVRAVLEGFAAEVGGDGPGRSRAWAGAPSGRWGRRVDAAAREVRAPAGRRRLRAGRDDGAGAGRHHGGRPRRGARRARADRRPARLARRDRRRGAGRGAERGAPPRLRPRPRHRARGAGRHRIGRAGEGRGTDGEERQRLRPGPVGRRLARHPRLHRRGGAAHPSAARHDPMGLVGGRSVRGAGPAAPTDGAPVGRDHHLGLPRGPPGRRGGAGAAGRGRPTPADRPELPPHRWSLRPAELRGLPGRAADTGRFVAEVGVGIVHAERPAPEPVLDPVVLDLHRRVRAAFDPTGRLNPGRAPW